MPSLEDLLVANNGLGDRELLLDDGTWTFNASMAGNTHTVTPTTRPSTAGGPFKGDLVVRAKNPGLAIVDLGGRVVQFSSALPARLAFIHLPFYNGILKLAQPNIRAWASDVMFRPGEWGAGARHKKTATARLTGGSTQVVITGGTDRFAAGDKFAAGSNANGFLKAHAGGDYVGISTAYGLGWHFGLINAVADSTHCTIDHPPGGLANGQTVTTTIQWGGTPGTWINDPIALMASETTSKSIVWYASDIQSGDGVIPRKSTDVNLIGCRVLKPWPEPTLDPPSLDTLHNDAIQVVRGCTRLTVKFCDIQGRFIMEDSNGSSDTSPGLVDFLMEDTWVHDNVNVFQMISHFTFANGGGIRGVMRRVRVWKEGGGQATLPSPIPGTNANLDINDTDDVVYGVAQTGPSPADVYQAAHSATDAWRHEIYGLPGGGGDDVNEGQHGGPVALVAAASNDGTTILRLSMPTALPAIAGGAPYTPQAGDILLAIVTSSASLGGGGVTDPEGWTSIEHDNGSATLTIRAAWKEWEPGDSTFDWAFSSGLSVGSIIAARGADAVAPIDTHAHASNASAVTAVTLPGASPARPFDLQVSAAAADDRASGNTVTRPTGFTRATHNTADANSALPTLDVFWRDALQPGAVASVATVLGTADQWESVTITLRAPEPTQPATSADFEIGIPIGEVGTVTPVVVPDPPTSFGAFSGDAKLGFLWGDPPNGLPIEEFTVFFTPAPPGGQPAPVAGNIHTLQVPATNDVDYVGKIKAKNSAGYGAYSANSPVTTPRAAAGGRLIVDNMGHGAGSLSVAQWPNAKADTKAAMTKFSADGLCRKLRLDNRDYSAAHAGLLARIDDLIDAGADGALIICNSPQTVPGSGLSGAGAPGSHAYDGPLCEAALADLTGDVRTKCVARGKPNFYVALEFGNEISTTTDDGWGATAGNGGIHFAAWLLRYYKHFFVGAVAGDPLCYIGAPSLANGYTSRIGGAGHNIFGQPEASPTGRRMHSPLDLYLDLFFDGPWTQGDLGSPQPTIATTGCHFGCSHPYMGDGSGLTSAASPAAAFYTALNSRAAAITQPFTGANRIGHNGQPWLHANWISQIMYDGFILAGKSVAYAIANARVDLTECSPGFPINDWHPAANLDGSGTRTHYLKGWVVKRGTTIYHALRDHDAATSGVDGPPGAVGTTAWATGAGGSPLYGGSENFACRTLDALAPLWDHAQKQHFGLEANPYGVWAGGPNAVARGGQPARTYTRMMWPFMLHDTPQVSVPFKWGVVEFGSNTNPAGPTVGLREKGSQVSGGKNIYRQMIAVGARLDPRA